MFELHTPKSAPPAAAARLVQAEATIGFIPGVFRVLAEAPVAYAAYDNLYGAFVRETAFTPLERQVIMMTANRANGCTYCMAGHSMMMEAAKMPAEHIRALRDDVPLANAKLEALRRFTADLIDRRGHLDDARVRTFLDAGYSRAHALEILVGLAAKLIANFASSLAELAPDALAQAFAWKPAPATGV